MEIWKDNELQDQIFKESETSALRDSTASEMTAQILQPVLRLVEAVAVDEKASIYMVGARIKSVSITLMS